MVLTNDLLQGLDTFYGIPGTVPVKDNSEDFWRHFQSVDPFENVERTSAVLSRYA